MVYNDKDEMIKYQGASSYQPNNNGNQYSNGNSNYAPPGTRPSGGYMSPNYVPNNSVGYGKGNTPPINSAGYGQGYTPVNNGMGGQPYIVAPGSYGQYGYPPFQQKEVSGCAISSMIIGIIAFISCIIGGISVLLSILAIVLGIIALTGNKGGRGMAVAGIILSSIAIIPAVLFILLGTAFLSSLRF